MSIYEEYVSLNACQQIESADIEDDTNGYSEYLDYLDEYSDYRGEISEGSM